MEKLPMCRICLVEDVHMFVVVNRNLHELYEKLTDIPFVTTDSRPMLACFFCCAKLKQCYQLQRKCLDAEELFTQMLNEDYKPNPVINRDHLEFCSGFIKSPIVHISIVDVVQTESIAIKEELPAVCEGLDDIVEPKEEHQSDELELENLDNSCLEDEADIQLHHSESDLEDDVPIRDFKTEVVEEKEVSKKKRRSTETRATVVAKKPKLDTRRAKPEEATTAEKMRKNKSDSIDIRTTQKRTSKTDIYFKELYKSDQRSFNPVKKMLQHTRTHIGKKPYKCDVCRRSFILKGSLTNHIRIHSDIKPYKCDIYHTSQQTGDEPYKCDICHRNFCAKDLLTTHIRIHTDIKPYKCDTCQRSFTLKGSLTTHIRQHTGDKPYKCDICQRNFNQKGSLTTHIRQHTGDKPYKCDICQRNFTQKGSLTTHIRHTHW